MESVEQVLSGVRRRPVAVAAPGQAAPAEAGGLDVAHGDPDADPSDLPPVRSVSLDEAVTAEPDGLFEPRPGGAEPEGWEPPGVRGYVEGESVEVPELTTEVRRVWSNPDGTSTEELAASPVRFRDGSGRWRDYDVDLTARNGRLVPESAPSGESVATTADAAAVVQTVTDAGVVRLEQGGAEAVRGVVDGDEVVYVDAVDGDSDLVAGLVPGGFETTVVVPDGGAGRASFTQELTVPAGVVVRDGGPGVELVDAAGVIVGSYGSGVATDSSAQPVEQEVVTRLVAQDATKATVSVSVDPAWLADPARVFPVAIDPTFTQNTAASGAMDTYVQSNIVNTPQANATELKVGEAYGTTYQRRALLRFNTSSLVGPNRQVLSANLGLLNSYSPSCGSLRAVEVRSLNGAFDANTVWSNQPGYGATTITSAPFAHGYNSSCPADGADIDIKTLVQKWVDGSTNNGIGIKAVDETDSLAGKTFMSGEAGFPPTVTVTYNRPPVNATLRSPAAAATVRTIRPTLTVNPGSDPDGDALRYWWTVSTGPDGSGQVLSSGWQAPGATSWQVPAGSLLDGTVYYWSAYTWDGISWPDPQPSARPFTVDLRLGDSGVWPTDEVGPGKVNLTNGNLVVSTGSPTFNTVGGGIGVNFTYNHTAGSTNGLTGSYYSGFDAATRVPAPGQEPTVVRRDSVASFDWKTAGPGAALPADNFYVKWKGYLRVPTTGGYKLGGDCNTPDQTSSTGGVRYKLDTTAMGSWVGCNTSGTDPWTGLVSLTAGQIVPIEAEYWTGTGRAEFVLKVRGPGLPAPAGIEAPSAWLSTTAPALPAGWNVSADLDGAANYRSAVITSDAITWGGSPLRLTDITDPVSGRKITLQYAGDSGCATAPPGGLAVAPAGMLCSLDYGDFAGGRSDLWYNAQGQLARIVDPGDATAGSDAPPEVTDFAYDALGRLAKLRDPLGSDAVAAGVRADDDSTMSLFAYSAGSGKVTSIRSPEPMPGEARVEHTYDYALSTTTNVRGTGLASTTGRLRQVVFDDKGRLTTDTDQAGRNTYTVWDSEDRALSSWDDRTNLKSTSVYDAEGNPIEQWGPAPTSWWPAANATGAPLTAQQAATPVERTRFDEGIGALAATWWTSTDLSGSPTARATGNPTSANPLSMIWGAGGPAELGGATDFSGRVTGWINITNTSPWSFRITGLQGKLRLYVDNQLVTDAWDTAAVDTTFTPASAGWKQITIEYANPSGNAQFGVWWRQGSASYVPVPGTALRPGYGLETSSTDADGDTTATSYSDAGAGLGPEEGLATATTVDPAGLALVSKTAYETGGYRRETSRQLPTGAASTVTTSYYSPGETRDLPACAGGGTAVNQGAMSKVIRSADPSGAGTAGIARESVFDAQGRTAASRVDAEPWTCTTYDARSRPTRVEAPGLPGAVGRVTDTDHAVNGNPLATSTTDTTGTDPARTVTATVDLVGRVRGYEDAWGNVTTTTYDAVGREARVTSPVGVETMTYDNDGNDGPTVIDGATLATPSYDPAGRLSSVTYANGTRSDPVVRDVLGRETSAVWRRTGDGTVLGSETSSLSLGGNVTDLVTDGNDPRPNAPNYLYDRAGRLTEAWTATRDAAGTVGAAHAAYGFGTADASCGSGTLGSAGRNTNRTRETVGDGAAAVSTTYCYDAADRLVTTTEAGVGAIAYDGHGNTTGIWGETRRYDATDRYQATTKGATTVTYQRDGADRIIARTSTAGGGSEERYGYTGGGDSPDLTLDAIGAVVERTIALAGGALLTRRGADQVWSLPNLHGDTTVVTDAAGVVAGPTRTYDPSGDTTGQPLVDNSAGLMDYAWLGQHQRPTEHEAGLAPTIEMGARQYDPTLGRFLEVDPIEGGSANDYDYTNGDPVNGLDLDGNWGWRRPRINVHRWVRDRGRSLRKVWNRGYSGYARASQWWSTAWYVGWNVVRRISKPGPIILVPHPCGMGYREYCRRRPRDNYAGFQRSFRNRYSRRRRYRRPYYR